MSAAGTFEDPFTCAADGDRRGRVCRCACCNFTATCTPNEDFYDGQLPNGLLYCKGCMWTAAEKYEKKVALQ